MKLTLYLETSVVGAYLDNDDPFRRDLTLRWWEYDMGEYQAFVSPLVYHELEQLAEPYRSAYLNLIRPLPQLPLRDEATMLAAGYVGGGIFHRRFLADAFHVALASVHNIDFCDVEFRAYCQYPPTGTGAALQPHQRLSLPHHRNP